LITQKWSDFELFKKAVGLVERKEHLTPEGLEKILSIKAVFNNGLSEDLNAAAVGFATHPNIVSYIRPELPETTIPDPY
jgi:hypothetical protein